jgi:uncharacterized protein DUF6113
VLTCLSAAAAGAAAGVAGSFRYAWTARGLPLGLLTALLLTVAVIATVGLASRGRLAPAVAAVAWVVVVVLLSVRRPEGDLVVTGTALGSLWLLAGSLLAGSAVTWPYAVRPGDGPLRRVTGSSTAGAPDDR